MGNINLYHGGETPVMNPLSTAALRYLAYVDAEEVS